MSLIVCVCRGVFTATLEDEEVSSDQPDLASTDSPDNASSDQQQQTNKTRGGFASVVQILVEDIIKPSNALEE